MSESVNLSQKERRLRSRIKKLVEKYPDLIAEAIIEQPFWPADLSSGTGYKRFSDDNNSSIGVVFSSDGDAWVEVWEDKDPRELMYSPRFRTFFGGGQSLRTRNAFLILAKAMLADNTDC